MPDHVVVVGAGPAGATCALRLAEAGVGVTIVDRSAPPRYKTCGGGIVGRALAELGVDVSDTVERRCHRLRLILADAGIDRYVERPEPPVVMTMRSEFDARLVEAAVCAGAQLRAPLAVTGLRHTPDGIELDTGEDNLAASCVVAADGAGGRVARLAGWGPPRRTIPAIESEIQVEEAVFERFADAARFDFGLVPSGYGWVFPKRRHLSVGCLATAPPPGGLVRQFEAYLSALGLAGVERREDHGFVIPTRPRGRRLARGRVLLVGDAAGLADPVTCEGISNAIRSGALAARAVLEERAQPSRASARYQTLLERLILPELRIARCLAPLLYEHPRVRRFVFSRLGRPLSEALTDVFTGRRTYKDLVTGWSTYRHLLGGLIRGGREAEA